MRKLALLAGLMAAFVIDTYSPPPADACGVKLAIKYSRPRRAAAASAKPSTVLLVGAPPKRLEHDLASAGHSVEVTPDPANHKRTSYDIIVVANNDQREAAQQAFPHSTVIMRSGDVTADVRSIEGQVNANRTLIATGSGRTVVAAGPTKVDPTAAGGAGKPGEQIGAKTPDEARKVGAKTEETKIAAKPEERSVKSEPAVAKSEPKTESKSEPETKSEHVATASKTDETKDIKPKVPVAGALDSEVYFGLNSSALSDKKGLDKAAKWLKANPDASATVEGYADPTGSRDWNMTLSQQRAEAARDYLVAQGVDTSRLEVVGYGDTKMKYGHADKRNRRVAVEAK